MGRAKPFGSRKKKEQLKAKREKKRLQKEQQQSPTTEERTRRQIKRAAVHAPVETKNKLRTVFEKETKAEVDKRKFASQKPLHRWKSRIAEDYFARQFISMPKRPAWNYNMSKQQLERNEQQYFEHWLDTIYKNYPQERLNWFEHNLEVWRQLWRVIERSDILVVVADARHPLFHFPPSLYKYVVEDHRKPIMLVLNKIDLVAEDILAAWVRYFEKRYPELKVVSFTSFPHDEGITLGTDADVEIEKKRKKRMRKKYRAVGKEGLIATWASFGVKRGNAVIRPPAPKHEDEEADRSSEYESDDDDEELVIESPSYERVLSDENEGEAEDSEEDKEQVNTKRKKQPAKQKQGKQQKASREVDTSDEDDWARADIKKERDRKRRERKKRAQQTRQHPGSQSKTSKQISADDEEVEEEEEEEEKTVNKHGKKKQAHQSKAKQQGGHAKQRQDHKKATQASKGQNKKHQDKQRVIDSEEEEQPEEEESEEKEEEEHTRDGDGEEEEEESEEEEEDDETQWEREQKRKKEQELREMRELGIESTLEDDLDYADEATLREHLRNLNYVTVGMVGHPNVGKSSLINGLVGRKVVSTSSTPGHTKFLQTIFLTKDIRLCDCPGLTFPSVDMPRPLQILCGLYPIAQVREPYSSIQFLAERIPLEKIYGLTPPPSADSNFQWSAYGLAEAFARKKSYTTRHGAWDTYRAGNEILRDAYEGRLILYFYPPDSIPNRNTTKEEGANQKEYQHAEEKEEEEEEEEEEATQEKEKEEEAEETQQADAAFQQTQNAFASLSVDN